MIPAVVVTRASCRVTKASCRVTRAPFSVTPAQAGAQGTRAARETPRKPWIPASAGMTDPAGNAPAGMTDPARNAPAGTTSAAGNPLSKKAKIRFWTLATTTN